MNQGNADAIRLAAERVPMAVVIVAEMCANERWQNIECEAVGEWTLVRVCDPTNQTREALICTGFKRTMVSGRLFVDGPESAIVESWEWTDRPQNALALAAGMFVGMDAAGRVVPAGAQNDTSSVIGRCIGVNADGTVRIELTPTTYYSVATRRVDVVGLRDVDIRGVVTVKP